MPIMHQDIHLFRPHNTQILQLQTDANKAKRCAFIFIQIVSLLKNLRFFLRFPFLLRNQSQEEASFY